MGASSPSNADLRARVRRQEVVTDLSKRAIESDDLDSLFRDAAVAVAETLDTDCCAVLEQVPNQDVFVLRQGTGWPTERVDSGRTPLSGDSHVRHVFDAEDRVVIDDFRTDERFTPSELFSDRGIDSGIAVRLGSSDDPWGVLGTYATARRSFTDAEVEFVRSVADVLESAIGRERTPGDLEEVYGRISDAFFALDEQWRFTYLNERAHELINPEGRTLVGKRIWDEFPETIGRAFEPKYERAMTEQETVSFEEYYPEPLDTWFEVRAYPSETGLSVYFRDVTDRKQFGKTLTTLYDSARGLLDAETRDEVSEVVVETATDVLDLSGVVTYLYDEDEHHLYPAAQSIENDFMRETLPAVPPDDSSITGHVYASGETCRFDDVADSPYLQPDETDMNAGVFVPMRDHGVLIVGSRAVGAFDEQTQQLVELLASNAEAAYDRVERERALEESEQRYRTLVEHFPNGAVALVDRDFRYVTFGGTPEGDTGVTSADLEGEPLRDALPPELADVVVPGYEAALDGELSTFESTVGDGVYQFHFIPVRDDDGEVFAAMGMSQDITERVEAQRDLEKSEQRYRTLAEYFPNGAVTLFDDGLEYTLLAGQGFENVAVDPDEAEGRHVRDVWGDDIADALEPVYRDALAGAERTVELSYDGREWITRAVPITDEEGTVFAGMAMIQDVTEQKERERYLRDAKSQLEAATEAGAVGTWELDVQNDEMFVGPSFAQTFDIDPDVAQRGVSLDRFIDAIHEDDRERVVSEIEDAVEACGEYEAEYRVWNADGELRWVVARGRVECNDDGKPITFPGALTDITERKRAELERRRNQEQLETLFEILPVGVVVADADGSLIRANDAAREIWGGDVFDADSVAEYDKYPAVWAETGEPVAPDDWTMAQVLDGAEVTEPNVYEITAFDGKQRIIMEYGMPIRDEYGDVSRAVVTLTDITERREYRRKLEESNERLEQFAYAASHDLQEPLRMITSYLQLLENRYGDAFDEDGEEFLEYAVDGAERMREMIDALLEYSRIETRGDPFEPIDLNGILEDVLADLQVRIAESGAEVTVEELPHLEGDASQLRQLFQNLLDNAVTYSGDSPPSIRVSADRRDGEWVISVEDDGIGIDPDDQERVFTVFDRLHSREEYDGTGIGLALCERIVERHGGEIWLESEPGEGATFSFTLPASGDR
ncbi:PAS domain-containing protein [Natrinema sp. 1APR25-10V2]|uniref:PAS domain-containing protein n=1 Tax=Natrinema sp. 1APR25-10V2 TaxID=2951081 RepID=UPI002874C36C|nr:PAS domain-containing protein [Natrinema sp. 1APR25-10V2]MDS0474443.1 PAS domain-containing protein [Natrinema sp. 1APR25-10V2]